MAENLKVLPNVIGSAFENPVRLSRHELVGAYTSSWFSRYYVGYYLMQVLQEGKYRMKLTFRDDIEEQGMVKLKFGPVGRLIEVRDMPTTEVIIDEILLPAGDHVMQVLYQNGEDIISPFYVELELLEE